MNLKAFIAVLLFSSASFAQTLSSDDRIGTSLAKPPDACGAGEAVTSIAPNGATTCQLEGTATVLIGGNDRSNAAGTFDVNMFGDGGGAIGNLGPPAVRRGGIDTLEVRFKNTIAGTGSYNCQIRKNGANCGLGCTVAASTNGCTSSPSAICEFDNSCPCCVALHDNIALRCTASGSPGAVGSTGWSARFKVLRSDDSACP